MVKERKLIVTILVFPNCGNSLNDGILKFGYKKFREQCLQFKQIFQGLIWPKNKIWSQWHHPVYVFFGGVGEVTSDLILSLPVSWLRVFYLLPDSGHDSDSLLFLISKNQGNQCAEDLESLRPGFELIFSCGAMDNLNISFLTGQMRKLLWLIRLLEMIAKIK